jgi:hypothetical protein
MQYDKFFISQFFLSMAQNDTNIYGISLFLGVLVTTLSKSSCTMHRKDHTRATGEGWIGLYKNLKLNAGFHFFLKAYDSDTSKFLKKWYVTYVC